MFYPLHVCTNLGRKPRTPPQTCQSLAPPEPGQTETDPGTAAGIETEVVDLEPEGEAEPGAEAAELERRDWNGAKNIVVFFSLRAGNRSHWSEVFVERQNLVSTWDNLRLIVF